MDLELTFFNFLEGIFLIWAMIGTLGLICYFIMIILKINGVRMMEEMRKINLESLKYETEPKIRKKNQETSFEDSIHDRQYIIKINDQDDENNA